MYWWGAMVGTAIAAVGLLYTVMKLKALNTPYQAHSGAARQSYSADESNPVLCETCLIPQMGDATTWIELECGHCYHRRCLRMFATTHCITCELQANQ
uniref:RING-type domain-containing protein n=1 Tax=Anopheles funestus TaxID=62324 RepID=A0A4Y0BFT3_ANOFN